MPYDADWGRFPGNWSGPNGISPRACTSVGKPSFRQARAVVEPTSIAIKRACRMARGLPRPGRVGSRQRSAALQARNGFEKLHDLIGAEHNRQSYLPARSGCGRTDAPWGDDWNWGGRFQEANY